MGIKDITIVIPSYLNGGSENFGINISKYLSKYAKVTLLSLKDDGILKSKIVKSKKLISTNFGKGRNRYKIIKLYKFLQNQKTIFSVMRDSNILCLICGFFLFNLNIIIREGNRLKNLNFFYILFLNFLYLRANKIIVNSLDIKNDIKKRFFFLNKKVIVLFNPIYNKNNKKIKNKNNREKVILNIGRLHKQKNHSLLLDCFAKCLKKNIYLKLFIVGNGPELKYLQKKILYLNLKDKVQIIDPTNNLDKIYSQADLYAHTSLYEGFPNVIAEAISNSLYCVTTPSSSSLNEIIFDKNFGHITGTFECKELSEVILKSLNLSGYDNSRFVKKFFIDFYGKNFLNVLDDICI